ncbi:hypothetical protein HMPREF9099_01472 [Lachnospiraceae bacterium oral taxon 082 str. F0431]|nr:hypothetical protein HMPREF9099_01472 [Lachnospiraceae bacterium oral taxon 082 str. F0431]
MIKEKKREDKDKDYLSILYPYKFHGFCVYCKALPLWILRKNVHSLFSYRLCPLCR